MGLKKVLLMIAAIVLLFLGATLALAYFSAPTKIVTPEKESVSFNAHIQDSGIADAGENTTAYATLGLSGSGVNQGNLTLLWFGDPVPRNVYLLTYPTVDTPDYTAFRQSLSAELRAYGFQLQDASVDDAASMSGSVLIAPTGAIPEFFTNNDTLKSFLSKGNVLIYVGMPFSYALNPDGSLSASNYSDVAIYSGNGVDSKLNGTQVQKMPDGTSVEFGGGYLFIIPKTLNGWNSANDAGKELAHMTIFGDWQKPLGTLEYDADFSGNLSLNKTLFTSSGTGTHGQARIIYELNTSEGAKRGSLDTPELEKLPGSLQGETPIFSGEEFNYSVFLNESYPQTMKLELGLAVIKDGVGVAKEPIATANVRDVWVSPSSTYRNNLPPGDYLVNVEDSDGNVHAKSYLHVNNVTALVASVNDFRYTFLVLLDGKPYSGEKVTVSLDSSEMTKELTTDSEGKILVPADVPSGKHTFHLLVSGRALEVPYDNDQVSLAGFYLRYGIPVLLVSAGLYILLKRPAKRKYRVVIPGFADPEPRPVVMKEKEFMKVFDEVQKDYGWKNAPLTSAEIRSGLRRRFARQGKEMIITDSNLSEVMEGLEKRNLVKSWGEHYIPEKWLDGKGPEFHAARRIVRDKLVEKGLEYTNGGNVFSTENGMGKVFYHVYDGNGIIGKVLANAKEGKNIVVFPEEEALSRFVKSLNALDSEKIRMRMEVEFNGVTLTTLAKLGEAA